MHVITFTHGFCSIAVHEKVSAFIARIGFACYSLHTTACFLRAFTCAYYWHSPIWANYKIVKPSHYTQGYVDKIKNYSKINARNIESTLLTKRRSTCRISS